MPRYLDYFDCRMIDEDGKELHSWSQTEEASHENAAKLYCITLLMDGTHSFEEGECVTIEVSSDEGVTKTFEISPYLDWKFAVFWRKRTNIFSTRVFYRLRNMGYAS